MSFYSRKYKLDSEKYRLYYRMFFKKGTKILDIGCGIGNLLLQDSANIIGIDIDEEQLSKARKMGLKVMRHDVNKKLPFASNKFEAINCKHVLEHVENPLFVLREMKRVLKKGGKLVLLTDLPSRQFWDDYTHKRPFTLNSLKQLTYDTDFRKYEVYLFPKGLFGINILNKLGLSAASCKKIERFFGKIKQDTLILEAYK